MKRLLAPIAGAAALMGIIYLGNTQSDIQEALPDDGGRIVLCTGIIANTANIARDDPSVIRICREVGVDRADYPPTFAPTTP